MSLKEPIVLGLGSNYGDRLRHLRTAVRELRAAQSVFQVLRISPIYESAALLEPHAPEDWKLPFLNLAVLGESPLGPFELLHWLKDLETRIGRIHRDRWGPREIDIDLLAVGNRVLKEQDLELPHPGLLKRPFAALPFQDVLPHWPVHSTGTISDWNRRWFASGTEIPLATRRSALHLMELVGIVNLTTDSLSKDGITDPEVFKERSKSLLQNQVEIWDLGAESTQPGQTVLTPPEAQWQRLRPMLEILQTQNSSPSRPTLSIDTRDPSVIKKCLELLPVHWLNDVSGLSNPAMIDIALEKNLEVVLMHSLSIPPSQNSVIPKDQDPVLFLKKWATTKLEELHEKGLPRERVIFDPGIGFGKTPDQSWEIIRRIREFHDLRIRILVGHSRKSFLKKITSADAKNRDAETTALACFLAESGVDYVRIHNEVQTRHALKAWALVHGFIPCQP